MKDDIQRVTIKPQAGRFLAKGKMSGKIRQVEVVLKKSLRPAALALAAK